MKARVVAVEPQPAFARMLHKKFGANPRFVLIDQAVADLPGKAIMKISRRNPTVSTLSDEWIATLKAFDKGLKWEEKVEVKVTTLDDLIGTYGIPDFCKIDIEGYEEIALTSLSHPIPALSFEVFPTTPDSAAHCIRLLENLGRI